MYLLILLFPFLLYLFLCLLNSAIITASLKWYFLLSFPLYHSSVFIWHHTSVTSLVCATPLRIIKFYQQQYINIKWDYITWNVVCMSLDLFQVGKITIVNGNSINIVKFSKILIYVNYTVVVTYLDYNNPIITHFECMKYWHR